MPGTSEVCEGRDTGAINLGNVLEDYSANSLESQIGSREVSGSTVKNAVRFAGGCFNKHWRNNVWRFRVERPKVLDPVLIDRFHTDIVVLEHSFHGHVNDESVRVLVDQILKTDGICRIRRHCCFCCRCWTHDFPP